MKKCSQLWKKSTDQFSIRVIQAPNLRATDLDECITIFTHIESHLDVKQKIFVEIGLRRKSMIGTNE